MSPTVRTVAVNVQFLNELADWIDEQAHEDNVSSGFFRNASAKAEMIRTVVIPDYEDLLENLQQWAGT